VDAHELIMQLAHMCRMVPISVPTLFWKSDLRSKIEPFAISPRRFRLWETSSRHAANAATASPYAPTSILLGELTSLPETSELG